MKAGKGGKRAGKKPKYGPTLREMLADARERQKNGQDGIRCPRCHCPDTYIQATRKGINRVRRVRVCQHCGHRIPTFESQGGQQIGPS